MFLSLRVGSHSINNVAQFHLCAGPRHNDSGSRVILLKQILDLFLQTEIYSKLHVAQRRCVVQIFKFGSVLDSEYWYTTEFVDC